MRNTGWWGAAGFKWNDAPCNYDGNGNYAAVCQMPGKCMHVNKNPLHYPSFLQKVKGIIIINIRSLTVFLVLA